MYYLLNFLRESILNSLEPVFYFDQFNYLSEVETFPFLSEDTYLSFTPLLSVASHQEIVYITYGIFVYIYTHYF